MLMKMRSSIISGLIFLSVIIISFLAAVNYNDVIIRIITTFSALAGVVGLLYSFMLDRRIAEASFLFELYTAFRENGMIQQSIVKLENVYLSREVSFTEADRQSIVECLLFFEALASMEHRGVISISGFDSLFGYDFFITVNNEDVRELEYVSYQEYYSETARLEAKWRKYRIRHGLPIPLECKHQPFSIHS